MKKALLMFLLVALVMPVFQSCKKGDNDPLISFRTRKARLVGEWTLKEGNITESWVNGNSSNYTYDGDSVSRTITGQEPYTVVYNEKISIKKDGSYKKVVNWGGSHTSVEGTWYFGRKNKELDIKNKETVWFTVLADSNSNDPFIYSGTDALNFDDAWLIDELRNKEIVVLIDGLTTISGSPYSMKGTMTYVQK